jgi:hypothetical protein
VQNLEQKLQAVRIMRHIDVVMMKEVCRAWNEDPDMQAVLLAVQGGVNLFFVRVAKKVLAGELPAILPRGLPPVPDLEDL